MVLEGFQRGMKLFLFLKKVMNSVPVTCFATYGFSEVVLRCVDMVSEGFQRGVRGVSKFFFVASAFRPVWPGRCI